MSDNENEYRRNGTDDREDLGLADANKSYGELPMLERKGKVKFNFNALITLVLIAAIVVVVVLIFRSYLNRGTNEPVITQAQGGIVSTNASANPTQTPEPDLRPESTERGLLPEYNRAYTSENKLAVTVTGSINESRMDKLLKAASEANAKLTFFPTGSDIEKNPEIWQEAALMGHEIESCGYAGIRYIDLSREQKVEDIEKAIQALKDYIHKDYRLHFVRTNDPYDYSYAELHSILISHGVYAMASQSAQLISADWEDIQPGIVINMNINQNTDISELARKLKYLSDNGYELVTMNELFEYENNYYSTPETE